MTTQATQGVIAPITATGTTAARRIEDRFSDAVSVKDFGAVGDGVADDTAAIQAAVNYTISNGFHKVDLGTKHLISSTIVISEASLTTDLTINGNGCIITRGANCGFIDIRNGNSGFVDVSSVTEVTRDLSPDSSVQSFVTEIVAPGHTYQVGDVVKIFSDDLIPDNTGNNERLGEFFVVAEALSDRVYSTGRLFDSYTTGIKLVKPNPNTVHMKDFTVSGDADEAWTSGAILIGGFVSPTVRNIHIIEAGGVGLTYASCYMPKSDSVYIGHAENNITGNQFGYGINEESCYCAVHQNVTGWYNRHVYTTNVGSTASGDNDWLFRGRSIGSIVSSSTGHGCGAAAWDTHPAAYGITFNGCKSFQDFRGDRGDGAGFNIRGTRVKLLNCEVYNSYVGINMTQNDVKDTEIFISGFCYEGEGVAFRFNSSLSSNVQRVTWQGGFIRSSFPNVFIFNDCNVAMRDVEVECPLSTNFGAVFSVGGDTSVSIVGCNFYTLNAVDTNMRLVRYASSGVNLRIESCNVYDSTVAIARVVDFGSNTGDCYYNITTESTLGPVDGSSGRVAGSNLSWIRTEAGVSRNALQTFSGQGSGNKTLSINDCALNTVNLELITVSSGAAVNELSDGSFVGQVARVINGYDSTDPLLVNDNPAGNLRVSGGRSLNVGDGLALTWNGSHWISG